MTTTDTATETIVLRAEPTAREKWENMSIVAMSVATIATAMSGSSQRSITAFTEFPTNIRLGHAAGPPTVTSPTPMRSVANADVSGMGAHPSSGSSGPP